MTTHNTPMKQTEKLASAVCMLKSAGKLTSILKSLGLLGGGTLAGGLMGEQSGYNRGFNESQASGQKDLLKGLELMLKDISQKGKQAR